MTPLAYTLASEELSQSSGGLPYSIFWKKKCLRPGTRRIYLRFTVHLTQQDQPRPPNSPIVMRTIVFTWLCTSPTIWPNLHLCITPKPCLSLMELVCYQLIPVSSTSPQHPHYLSALTETWASPRSELPLKTSQVAALFSPILHVWPGPFLNSWFLYAPWKNICLLIGTPTHHTHNKNPAYQSTPQAHRICI